jgi:CheY-like chemotaxis protein
MLVLAQGIGSVACGRPQADQITSHPIPKIRLLYWSRDGGDQVRRGERAMGSGGKRILCIDDEPNTCEMFQVVLPEYEIVSAICMAVGVKLARDDHFSLIFLDYYLPDGTGAEVCGMIRTFDRRTPILFVTGSRSFTERHARAIGAQGTVKKASPTFIEQIQTRTNELVLN